MGVIKFDLTRPLNDEALKRKYFSRQKGLLAVAPIEVLPDPRLVKKWLEKPQILRAYSVLCARETHECFRCHEPIMPGMSYDAIVRVFYSIRYKRSLLEVCKRHTMPECEEPEFDPMDDYYCEDYSEIEFVEKELEENVA